MVELESELVDAVAATVDPLLPASSRSIHSTITDRQRLIGFIFWGILIFRTTGAPRALIETIFEFQQSHTTLRAWRHEWITAGVFGQVREECLRFFDQNTDLELSDVVIAGSLDKGP